MEISELAELLNAKIYCMGEDKEVTGGYCGDFLSFVMSKAPCDCAWYTIMNNINVAAVASLTEVSAVVLCESVKPDDKLLEKMTSSSLALLGTELTVYEAVLTVNGK